MCIRDRSGPSGRTGAVAEVDARVAGVDADRCTDEVTTGDTVLLDEPTPWSVGDVHAASSMTMAAPHMVRWSVMFWRLRSSALGWLRELLPAQHRPLDARYCRDGCVFVFVDRSPYACLLYTSPSPRDRTRSRMPSS